jgi:hypothetical protein
MNQGEFILMGLGVVILLGNAVTAWAVLTGKAGKREIQQPLVIKSERELVSKRDHEETLQPIIARVSTLENEVRVIRLKMESDKMEIIEAGEGRLREIREELNDIRKDIAATPAQVIALLKNTKGLIE